ncbi:hypothetical protein U9M48_012879 [Paspalum notatum var. saurae]|uniref:SOSEKI DIX-like domain-containing protein n=1 Tax=Paspalum notatum var. saurae TaxID=547442 RepID=A0AAQ3T165_PASNO
MERRASRRRHGSPGQDGVPVSVVYYLCRSGGRHLEHPHLMEMHLASPNQALYLRDVIRRLDALRGKGMAAMYSWSCKRRYKTGFVWHDVLDDDLLLPAQGSEYVLKGSLLLLRQTSPPALVVAPPPEDHDQPNVVGTTVSPEVPCVKPTTAEESPTHSKEHWTTNSSSSSPTTVKAEDEAPHPAPALHQGQQPVLSSISPSSCCTTGDRDTETTASARSSCSGSPSSPSKPATRRSAGSAPPPSGSSSSITPPAKANVPTNDKQPENAGPFSSRTRSRSGTLESLIRAEALGRRGATAKRILEEEQDDKEALQSLGAKLNPANLLMRLVSCGSTISARQHLPACGVTRTTHKPQHLAQHVELLPSSPVLSPLGALILRHGSAPGARVVSDSGDCDHCRGNLLQPAGKGCESGKVMSTIVQPSLSHEHGRYISYIHFLPFNLS